jgi:hypothetical protein
LFEMHCFGAMHRLNRFVEACPVLISGASS